MGAAFCRLSGIQRSRLVSYRPLLQELVFVYSLMFFKTQHKMGLISVCSCFCSSSSDISTEPSSSIVKELCHQFSLAEIQSATSNFKESLIIGQTGYGTVYKGYLAKSSSPVVIRSCEKESLYGLRDLKKEVVLLCQLQHPNLVPLVGFYIDRKEMGLVYEYMSNSSLYPHLHGRISDPLTWKRRLQICIGVARGLHYLHTGTKYAIIHRDIKTSIILLDNNWEPKVSGFLLSKRGPLNISKSLIRVESPGIGTEGYADPEYMATGVLTEKSDVYSFGVVLLEVVSAKKARELHNEHLNKRNHSLKSYAEKIVDPFLKSKIAPGCWKTFIDITERCLLEDGRERPNMGEVEVELERALQLQEEADANAED